MKKVTDNKLSTSIDTIVLSNTKGGTGGTTVNEAIESLGLISSAEKGVPFGIATLTSSALVNNTELPSLPKTGAQIVLNGPSVVSFNSVNEYVIVGYSSLKHYDLSVSIGEAYISGSKVFYVAPDTAGDVTITVNGISYTVTVTNAISTINTPNIVSPVSGSTTVDTNPTFTSSVFSVSGAPVVHVSTDWQVSTDSAFTSIVDSSIGDTVNKTTWNSIALTAATVYYVRVRYTGQGNIKSSWSLTAVFTTKDASFSEEAILVSSNPGNILFGWSADIDDTGTRVVVGAGSITAVELYVFTRSGNSWSQENILTPRATGLGSFGDMPRIDSTGTRIVAGARDDTRAYIFVRTGTTWTQEAILTSSSGLVGAFGHSVDIDSTGTRVVVGAINNNNAFVFTRSGTTWTEEAILISSDGLTGQFGYSVAINSTGERIVVGANSIHKAYVFIRSGTTWSQEAILISSDGLTGQFGQSVAIDSTGTRIVVGAINNNNAFVFTRSGTTWAQEAILVPTGGITGNFGVVVTMDDSGSKVAVALVGHVKAIVYTRSGTAWSEDQILTPSNSADTSFGRAVALNAPGDRIVVGAWSSNKAYIFS